MILLVLAVSALGMAALTAAEELYKFANKSLGAKSEKDLNESAQHLANAVAMVGVEVIMALFFKVRQKRVFKRTIIRVDNIPSTKGKVLYAPKIQADNSLPNIIKFLEEAIAEGVAQLTVHGVRSALKSVTFPVKNGYVTLAELGAEARGILLGPINVGGMNFLAYFDPNGDVFDQGAYYAQ